MLVERALSGIVRDRFREDGRLEAAVNEVRRGQCDPYTAAETLLASLELAE